MRDEEGSEPVHREPRKAVALSVDQPVGAEIGFDQGFAQRHGLIDALAVQLRTGGLIRIAGHQSNRHRALRFPVPLTEELTVWILNGHDLTGLLGQISAGGQRVAENPRVTSAKSRCRLPTDAEGSLSQKRLLAADGFRGRLEGMFGLLFQMVAG